ncbi:MAG: hypothetical protein EXR27_14465 [Betaproteobacteria bacterium]|nr:hypothetical protein [Betaproteobacteria bacterium]
MKTLFRMFPAPSGNVQIDRLINADGTAGEGSLPKKMGRRGIQWPRGAIQADVPLIGAVERRHAQERIGSAKNVRY